MNYIGIEPIPSGLQPDASTELAYKAEINRGLKSPSIIITPFSYLI